MVRAAMPLTWRERLARALYTAAVTLIQPYYLARLWWRGRAEPGYRLAMAERWGRYSHAASTGGVWLHAVSLGETRAAAALIDALRRERPGARLILTHGTATGREAGLALLQAGDTQAWLPLDLPGPVARFLAHHRPEVGVLMETEIWPNLIHGARRRSVPLVLANARLSAKSLRQGERLRTLMRPAVRSLALCLAQTEPDARRLEQAGASHVRSAGNLKFDMSPDPSMVAQGQSWRGVSAREVLLAAVTREGEEAALLAHWVSLPEPRPLLVIVPRHPQRFDEVASLVRDAGLSLARRSAWAAAPPGSALAAQVWLGDSMGEMPLYYGLAQVALLGGSFAPLGGQNLIEAAACGCPVVMGPHTFNFEQAAELALQAGAAWRVQDLPEGVTLALGLLQPARQQEAAARAKAFAAQHRGAARRMAHDIAELMSRRQAAASAPDSVGSGLEHF